MFSVRSFKDSALGSAGRKRELQESNLVRSCAKAHCRESWNGVDRKGP